MSGVRAEDLAGQAFLRGMADGHLAVLSRLCWVTPVREGHRFFSEGDTARKFWLIGSGHVALDLHAPGGRQLVVETLGQGDLLGLSWLIPPYQWQFGATAVQGTMTFEFDAAAVRAACESDAGLGHELLRRAMSAALSRLQATRIRLLDLYGKPAPGREGP